MNQKKYALITAGLGGLGSEIKSQLEALGVICLLTSSRKELVNNKDIFYWNMEDLSSTKELTKYLDATGYSINYFIHSAHVFSDAKLILQIKEQEFLQSLQANTTAIFSLSKYFAKKMSRKKEGRLLFIGSYISKNPAPGKAQYIIEKNTLIGLALALHSEFYEKNVFTNIIHPGLIKTPQAENRISEEVKNLVGEENLLSTKTVAKKCIEILTAEPVPCEQDFKGNQTWKHSI